MVCVNRRLAAGQRSCAGSGSLELIRRLEAMIAAEKLDVAVVRRECLGRCEEGPVMRFVPAGPFFTSIDEASLKHVFAELKSFVENHRA